MKDNQGKIEERIENIKKVYTKIENVIDDLPDALPADVKKSIKKALLDDQELKKIMKEIDDYRPPRLFLIGRTGSGKSSSINAMCNRYVAEVDDVKSCTVSIHQYRIKDEERTLMEVLDTRGICESESLSEVSAETQILNELSTFDPDVAILLLNAVHRDGIKEDVAFMKRVVAEYKKNTGANFTFLSL